MSYQESFNESIVTNLAQFPTVPQIRFKNPLKADVFVNAIELLPDTAFTLKGDVYVTIGRNLAFSTKGKPLGAYSLFPIPLESQEFHQGEYIEVFARNVIDSDTINLAVNIKISETQGNQTGGSQPLDRQAQKDDVSETTELFPFRVYNNESPVALLDMKGYKKLLITLSASSIPVITHPTSGSSSADSFNWRIYYVVCSGELQEGYQTETFPSFDTFDIIDTGNANAKSLQFAIGNTAIPQLALTADRTVHAPDDPCNQAGNADGNNQLWNIRANKVITFDVQESNDITFVTGVTTIYSNKTYAQLLALIPIPTTKRYVKIVQHISVTSFESYLVSSNHQNLLGHYPQDETLTVNYSIAPMTFSTFSDLLTQGGQAALSFEIKGSGNQWFELISAAEIGTITAGGQILKQIGDVVSRNNADKVGFILPSTQTNLRGKLTVTNAIETGVQITRVS